MFTPKELAAAVVAHLNSSGVTAITSDGRTLTSDEVASIVIKACENMSGELDLGLGQAMPRELDNPEFREAWDRWMTFRTKRRLSKLLPASVEMQLKKLASWGCAQAIASINQSIEQQWNGLFPCRETTASGYQKPGRGASFR